MTDVTNIIKLKAKVDEAKEVVEQANSELHFAKMALRNICNHPATEKVQQSMDDEYGSHFYTTRHKKCVFCEAVFDREIQYGYSGKWEPVKDEL